MIEIREGTREPNVPLKWQLKQKPGISPPRGGFEPDDPNQQIVAEEIFDEYGGFLDGGNIPELLTNFNSTKHKNRTSKSSGLKSNSFTLDSNHVQRSRKMKCEHKSKTQKSASHRRNHEGTNSPVSDGERNLKIKVKSKHKKRALLQDSDQESDSTYDDYYKHEKASRKKYSHNKKRNNKELSRSSMSEDSEDDWYRGKNWRKDSHNLKYRKSKVIYVDDSSESDIKSSRKLEARRNKTTRQGDSGFNLSQKSESEGHSRKDKHSSSSKVYDSNNRHRGLHCR
ncbi:hypothetical protein RDABS01_031516 [Bienertia sinuspersici]